MGRRIPGAGAVPAAVALGGSKMGITVVVINRGPAERVPAPATARLATEGPGECASKPCVRQRIPIGIDRGRGRDGIARGEGDGIGRGAGIGRGKGDGIARGKGDGIAREKGGGIARGAEGDGIRLGNGIGAAAAAAVGNSGKGSLLVGRQHGRGPRRRRRRVPRPGAGAGGRGRGETSCGSSGRRSCGSNGRRSFGSKRWGLGLGGGGRRGTIGVEELT